MQIIFNDQIYSLIGKIALSAIWHFKIPLVKYPAKEYMKLMQACLQQNQDCIEIQNGG